jgi:hypothetical protein
MKNANMKQWRQQLRVALILFLVVLLLACGVGAGLVRTGVVIPQDITLVIGPVAISAAQAFDSSCAEPFVHCDLVPQNRNQRSFYAIWLVYRKGSQPNQYGHFSIHVPIRR